MDVPLGYARTGVSEQRLDGWQRISKIVRNRCERMAQAVQRKAGHRFPAIRRTHCVSPARCRSSRVIEGKTYSEVESAEAALMTANAAAPIGRILFPVLVCCRRSTIRDGSTSVFSNP